MIVNIPLNIDETAFEGQMSKDIENKVVRWLSDEIKSTLKRKAHGTELDGLKEFVIDAVEKRLTVSVTRSLKQHRRNWRTSLPEAKKAKRY